MDGGNLQLLIAPKRFTSDSSPKSHTWGEEGKSQGKGFSQQNWSRLKNGAGKPPIWACPIISDELSSSGCLLFSSCLSYKSLITNFTIAASCDRHKILPALFPENLSIEPIIESK